MRVRTHTLKYTYNEKKDRLLTSLKVNSKEV